MAISCVRVLLAGRVSVEGHHTAMVTQSVSVYINHAQDPSGRRGAYRYKMCHVDMHHPQTV